MRIDGWIRKLLPRTDKFLDFFILDVDNLTGACRSLRALLEAKDETERLRLIKEIEDYEHRGDELTHQIFHELSLTFITTLDREDIGTLASAIDDIVDNIDRAATAIHLYKVMQFDDPVRDLAEIIEKSALELKIAIPLLKDLREVDRLREACVRINAYENQADQIFQRAVGRLFQEETDPIQLIKKKEILATLESATDMCEDAAVLIENVLVKFA
jgi:uncharacterized protein Yka (UPF0111/DUF47 family)